MNPHEYVKVKMLTGYVMQVFKAYGQDKSYFNEYMNELSKQDIDEALECFRALIKNLPKEGCYEQRLQGMRIKSTDI